MTVLFFLSVPLCTFHQTYVTCKMALLCRRVALILWLLFVQQHFPETKINIVTGLRLSNHVLGIVRC